MADEKKGVFGKIGSTIDSIGASSTKILGDEKNSKVVEKLHAGSKEPKSIAGMARKSIFEFPAFISTTVPLDYAEATCGLLELTYASYLQMAISQEPEYTMTNVGDPFAKWKTDTNNYLEVSDLTDTFDVDFLGRYAQIEGHGTGLVANLMGAVLKSVTIVTGFNPFKFALAKNDGYLFGEAPQVQSLIDNHK